MMDKRERAAVARRAKIALQLETYVALEIQALAGQHGQSVEREIEDAVSHWCARSARLLARQRQLELQKAFKEAAQNAPLAELLERFQRQMRDSSEWESETPLTSAAASVTTMPMANGKRNFRARREALGLSREAVARLADLSLSYVQQLEGGYTPKDQRKLEHLDAVLSKQERAAA